MTRTLAFLATIMIVASVGRAAENSSLQTRAAEDYTGHNRQPATAEMIVRQSPQSANSTAASTSQAVGTATQATVVERASLVADALNGGGSGPNATNRSDTADGKTSAAPDSSGRETTSPRDPAVQNVSEEPVATSGQLPQTSTILPLLGLIGLGSLVAGFFARR